MIYVRFTLNSGHLQRTNACPLSAKSGHSRRSPSRLYRPPHAMLGNRLASVEEPQPV